MKNGFVLIALLLVVILACVLIQLWRTRYAMAAFAGQQGMTYSTSRWNLFDIGRIQGKVGPAVFSMGSMSSKFTFGPVAAEHYPDEKSIFMAMTVKNMPLNMVIRRHGKGVLGDAVEIILSGTGYAVVKTGDKDFDARFVVIGAENEVMAWLTDHRREILKTFLSRKNCAVARGNLKIEFTSTFIRRDDIESAFLHIRESQLHLFSEG